MTERVLIIGLDSAPLEWIRRWADDGLLPTLGRLMTKGASGVLRSVNPPLSPAAWSSFATGTFPGKHGVFDHIYRMPGAYDIAPTSSNIRGGKPIWEIISEHGGTVGIINVPETYPPAPVNGFMISGMDTPSDEADFAYPSDLKTHLETEIGGYKVFGPRSKEDLDRSIAGMHQTIPMRARAGRYLWEKYQPDLMTLVFMETDVIQHKCWKYMDPEHPEYEESTNIAKRGLYARSIQDVYARIDEALAPWIDSLDENTTVIIMSDHGAGPLKKFLFLNNWLTQEGFMRLSGAPWSRLRQIAFRMGFTPTNAFDIAARLRIGMVDAATNKIKRDMTETGGTTLLQRVFLSWGDIDWSRTRAYTLGGNFTGIYINLKGREPEGCVEPGPEYDALRDEIAARLKRWADPDTGKPIVERVYMREELYSGPFTSRAPDVIFTTVGESYVGSGGHEFASNRLMARSALFNAHHRIDGMIAFSGPSVRTGRLGAHNIVDVAPTVLYLLGYPIPENMDGRVITQALTRDFLDSHPVRAVVSGNEIPGRRPDSEPFSQAEEDEILSRLRDLGYL